MYFGRIITALSLLGASNTLPTQDGVVLRGMSLPNMAWDDSLPDAKAQMEKFLKAWPQVIVMAKLLHLKTDPSLYQEVLKHYFEEKDASIVEKVWRGLIGAKGQDDQGDGTGNPLIFDIVLTNKPTDKEPCLRKDNVRLAWLEPVGDGTRAVMKIYDKGWQFPTIDETSDFQPLVDWDILDYTYGPKNTRSAVTNDDIVTILNADQYRWMAQEYYWSLICDKTFKAPTSNADYLDCQGTCVIQ
ncbi:uncharacterized protein FTJAE_8310 [Fusarium tjaetaba]|uniref:Uncharacterized protein n=1 Tax=Fusarium tjaetaba TaxID=1567544 RepID=A0A8H5RBF8_9HYPO|nr:uncharacterized protein FTJAE_8310 [Fusarium tjaetaba]KAF5630159.1 hypothetical protein FTJAE_8310 [Fusarium tjaetaba]